MFLGLVLVIIGGVALLVKLDVLTGSIWGYVWPLLLIALGLSLLLRRNRLFRPRLWCGSWSWGDKGQKSQDN